MRAKSSTARTPRLPAAVATVLIMLGVLAAAVRLDGPSDGTVVRLGWSTWRTDGVVVDVAPPSATGLRTGDKVTAIAGHRLADGFGGAALPARGSAVAYEVGRGPVTVVVERPSAAALLEQSWGNLVFVFALAGLAVALYVRRPEEPATAPLLVFAGGLLGSTLAVAAGLPALALATGGPALWLFHVNAVVAYSLAFGALLVFVPAFLGRTQYRWLYGAPLLFMAVWSAVAALFAPNALRWLGFVHSGQTLVVALSLVAMVGWGVAAYARVDDPLVRDRLRWLLGGGAVAALFSIAGWHLPELLTGHQRLPWGALGLSGLPFVAGIGIALRRHRLFDIERLANRSLVYASVIAILVGGYAAAVALLVSGLRLSDTVAAALAAAAAALALAPLRGAAQSAVNRVMYGDRQDSAAALDRLGTRLQAVILPADVLPAVVETVARSLRVAYAGIELVDEAGEWHPAAEHGSPVGAVHIEPLRYQGELVGRLSVSARGIDDPLDLVDLRLIGSLAQQVGTAVQVVRLHADLVRSRGEAVASREDERRRLRRDLHDGLGPTLAAIGLKAGLAARAVPGDSAALPLLDEISQEARSSLADVRRLVEALRPPALDELGVVGAVRSRAAFLAGAMAIEVTGPEQPPELPAAVETAAYRIAVEAITNAARHSGAAHCTVSIILVDGGVEVCVRDDGRGLDPDDRPGVGLRSMQERAAEVGGVWSAGSGPLGGTLVRAFLPTSPGGAA